MAWVRIDDEFTEHPKLLKAGPLAMLMQVAALCYCNRHLTDGFIPEGKVATLINLDGLGDWRNVLSDLLREGIWERVDGGYQVHDYLDYQPSREQVLADREIARRRAAMNADPALAKAVKTRDGNRCRYCGRIVDWRNRKGELGGTYDHIIPIHKGGTESVDNIVVCCRACNLKKGARTPEEAGMTLLPPPSRNQTGIEPESEWNQAANQTETRPPVPIPTPDRNTILSPSETGTQSVPDAKGPGIEEVNNQHLIAELVAEYRTIEGVDPRNGDYPFIGSLYNQYGYDQVLCSINALRQAMAVDPIQKPLVYLKGILKREVEGGGVPVQRTRRDTATPKPASKYDVLLKRANTQASARSDGGRGPPA